VSPADSPADPQRPPQPSVFLSYASEDRHAAQLIRDALPAFGLEVWYDESALDGGDVWDQKIRRQIRACDYFMPVISVQTEARAEGYFRREWRLAVERTLDMADDYTFLLPVVIDATTQAGARVPEKFLTVQWTRLPGGQPTPAFEALCRRLVSGHGWVDAAQPARRAAYQPAGKAADPPARTGAQAARREYPQIPREEPGQKLRFFVQVVGWALQSAWVFFRGFPRWLQILVYLWIGVLILSKGCMPSEERAANVPAWDADKLAQAANPAGSLGSEAATKLGTQIARDVTGALGVAGEVADGPAAHRPLIAIPFSAPPGDAAAQKLAAAAFGQVYGTVMVSHRGQVGLSAAPLSAANANAAVERGRAHHARYVLFGAVDETTTPYSLSVEMVSVANGSVLWSESFPLAGADLARIATEVDSKIGSLEDD
jgi:hypothetical protein